MGVSFVSFCKHRSQAHYHRRMRRYTRFGRMDTLVALAPPSRFCLMRMRYRNIMLVQCSRAPLRGPQTVYNLVIIRSRHQAEQPRGAVAAWARTLEALHTFGLGRRHRDWSHWCRQSRQMQLQKASLSASRLTQLLTILTLQSK
jgi:hypothetical protein